MKGMLIGTLSAVHAGRSDWHYIALENMANTATLKLIQDDILSIKSQIDILRMETKAHQLEPVAYLLDLAFQEVKKSEVSDGDASRYIRQPLTMQ